MNLNVYLKIAQFKMRRFCRLFSEINSTNGGKLNGAIECYYMKTKFKGFKALGKLLVSRGITLKLLVLDYKCHL